MIHGGMRRAGVGLAGVLHGVLLLLMLLLPASRHVTGATLDPKGKDKC
ncbi:hypothetical protein E2C01_091948 [Portunus trituberculatus]|uniref:Uncharacterized protein n=1 Tax=Portunus trituberculatus TaxID=210409 RepID=A0A5B7JQS0_PORTR|nr:hypothetical protein [Portunus trituberculatus]